MKLLKILCFFFCLPSFLSAQPYIDILSAHYVNSPQSGLFRQNETAVSFDRIGINASAPIKIKSHYLIFYPGYEEQKLQYESQSSSTVQSFYLPTAFVFQWKDQSWKTAITYIARVNGNLNGSSDYSKYFQNGAAILFINKKSDDLKLKYGAYINDEFFGIFVLPLFGLDWNINDKWQIFGTLPREMFLNRVLSNKSNAGLVFKARTNSYKISKEKTDGYFDIRENQLKLFANTKLYSDITLFAEAGHTFFRRTSFTDDTGEQFKDVNDALIFRVGIAYRVSTN
ncbi:MAG: hypothetical protein HKN22_03550 [Bacteroidia bacterium]|nr:hypothetical protein [Bacteroidia bacterium]